MSTRDRLITGRLCNRTLLYSLLLLAPLTLLSGCGSGQTGSGQSNTAPVNLAVSFPQNSASVASASTLGIRVWEVVQRWLPSITSAWAVGTVTDLASLTVEVSAPDLSLPITKTVPLSTPTSGQVITLTLDIPVGSNRVFTVSCLDRTRVRIFRGLSSPVTLSGGQAATVDIALTAAGVASSLTTARFAHTATLLQNGQALIVGGRGATGFQNSAELFEPATKQWSQLATSPTTVRLEDLLIPGASFTQGNLQFDNFSYLDSDGPTPDPSFPLIIRGTPNGIEGFGAKGADTLLGQTFISTVDFRVTGLDPGRNLNGIRSVLTFTPSGGSGGSLTVVSEAFTDAGHTVSLASTSSADPQSLVPIPLSQAVHQLFFRVTSTEVGRISGAPLTILTAFSQAPSTVPEPSPQILGNPGLITGRSNHTATLLKNGQVLVVGGQDNVGVLASAELFDPVTKTWTLLPTGLTTARLQHTATLLQNGQVLVVGGFDPGFIPLASAELFNPTTKTWSPVANLTTAREDHTATLLNNGMVLAVGGNGANGVSASAELFDPVAQTWSPVADLTTARAVYTATLLQNGQVLVVGGGGATGSLASAELFDPVAQTWSPVADLTTARAGHTATLLQNGQVLVVGGGGANDSLASAELFDPAMKTWTLLATGLASARESHTATLLQNGQVLVSGGDSCRDGCSSASAELFDLSLR